MPCEADASADGVPVGVPDGVFDGVLEHPAAATDAATNSDATRVFLMNQSSLGGRFAALCRETRARSSQSGTRFGDVS